MCVCVITKNAHEVKTNGAEHELVETSRQLPRGLLELHKELGQAIALKVNYEVAET